MQGLDRGVEIAMLLSQPSQLGLELAFFLVPHHRYPH